jgi:hypothetical protein
MTWATYQDEIHDVFSGLTVRMMAVCRGACEAYLTKGREGQSLPLLGGILSVPFSFLFADWLNPGPAQAEPGSF